MHPVFDSAIPNNFYWMSHKVVGHADRGRPYTLSLFKIGLTYGEVWVEFGSAFSWHRPALHWSSFTSVGLKYDSLIFVHLSRPQVWLFSTGHFQVFLQVTPTNYGILPQLLRIYYKWRQLHELQLPNRLGRRWSVYPSFSFQVLLLLTILNTAATQVLGKGKGKASECDSLSRRRHRSRILDGLMVQYQWAIVVKYLSYLFFTIDSEGRRRRAA